MGSRDQRNLRHVALFIGQLGLGGTETQVSLLARELQQRGIKVDVLVVSKGGPHEKKLRDAGIRIHHVGSRRKWPRRASAIRKLWTFVRLVRTLRRLRPDVLHAFLLEAYFPGTPAALLAGVPVMVAGRRSMTDVLRTGPRRRSFALASRMVRITDHVVANAVAVADDVRRVERIPPHKLSVIYNGMADAAFEPVERATIDTDHQVVLCLARLRPEKGHSVLIEAAGLLARQGTPCTFVLVGDGPEEERLKAQARTSNADIRFFGAMTDARGMLDRADVVVLPSISEGLSNAVMEAMARGRPIIATAVGGTPELLEDRGVLVPPSDPVSLSQAIARLLRDPETAASLGAAARAWATKNLRAATMAEEHIALYGRLLER
ncbi:glycosyltransferase family 4 protein [Nonomuraea sp. NPDC049480]|uniref:glycosyltransferase family 4 protein n=1 Tax=Nonomuraea sp. NPDC049480 TaxID=3364353 RepID=UPI00378DD18A